MERSSADRGLDETLPLFAAAEIPVLPRPKEDNFQSLQHPVWTEGKARLIQAYLKLFTFITKHGAYIDGFAAPQRHHLSELCSARLVLETQPERIRDFWLCELKLDGVTILEAMADAFQSRQRRITVLAGDFNQAVLEVLASPRLTARTATFALLDQRTFECDWATVRSLAEHKPRLDPATTKIEIFYFLATGWLDRSIRSVRRPATAERLTKWWGRDDWRDLYGIQGIPRARLVAKRFQEELGYRSARPYAIHDRRLGGRIMYHMIHATDHEEAPSLMLRAYRKTSGREDIDPTALQVDMESLWREAGGDVDDGAKD